VTRIKIADENWSTTLPVIVKPDRDEWLGGFLLRCDRANCWHAGETVAHILQSTSTKYFNPLAPPPLHLWALGQAVGLSLTHMQHLTYQKELARLEGLIPRLLLQPAHSFLLGVCPECIYQLHFIEKAVALPFSQVCLEHELRLQHQCSCHTYLKLFPRGKPPFCCAACGLDWQKLPHVKAEHSAIQAEETFRYFFSRLFSQGTPKRLARLLSFIEERQRRKEASVKAKQPSVHYISRLIARGTLSLEDVVRDLVLTNASFDEAFADWTNDQDQIAVIE
jgi:hypothetical protein